MSRTHTKLISASLMAIFVLALFPITVLAATPHAVVIGNSYTLQSGETLNDDLFILGGNVNLMNGSTINGSVFNLGGTIQAAGSIKGDVTILGGTLNLASTFFLEGNLNTAGTVINRDPAAQIKGQVNINNSPSITLPWGTRIVGTGSNFDPFLKVVGFFVRLFLWTLASMLAVMFLSPHMARISQTVISQPLISGGIGLLTAVVLPILLVLIALTICLIPVSLIGVVALVLAWIYGFISMGREVGQRITAALKQEWHPVISAGLGTLIMMTVLSGTEALIPCVGWIPKVIVGFLGLGAVILTQFGTKPYLSSMNPPQPASGVAG